MANTGQSAVRGESAGRLGNIAAAASAAEGAGARGLPPVHLWNPPFCGDIDMRIAADGTWFYQGSPIARPAMVRLFSTVLKREGDAYFLVTPVEKCGITVEDTPFTAVEMRAESAGDAQILHFRTNVGDWMMCDADHPLKFAPHADGSFVPYIFVRSDLWAKAMRPVYYDLMAIGMVRGEREGAMFGVESSGVFFAICPASQLMGEP